MTLREILEKHLIRISYAGKCECGEMKYDLITDDNLVYPPIHANVIRKIRPDLFEEIEEIENDRQS